MFMAENLIEQLNQNPKLAIERIIQGLHDHSDQVIHLDLSARNIGNLTEEQSIALCEALSELYHLQSLDLSFNELEHWSPEQWKTFFHVIGRLPYFRTLSFQSNHFADFSPMQWMVFLEGLSQLPNLRSLDLESNDLGDISTDSFLEESPCISKLSFINLGSNRLGNLSEKSLFQLLNVFSNPKNLKFISLENNALNEWPEKRWNVLLNFLSKLVHLQYLDLGSNNLANIIDEPLIDLFDVLSNLHNLAYLNLTCFYIELLTPECFKQITERISKLEHLQSLDLSWSMLSLCGEGQLKTFFQDLSGLQNLQFLSLYDGGIFSFPTPRQKILLEGLFKLKNLKSIDLTGDLNHMSVADLKFVLDQLSTFQNLQSINLMRIGLGRDHTPEQLDILFEGISKLKQVRFVDLSANWCYLLTPQQWTTLFENLSKMPNLESINLKHNELGRMSPIQKFFLFNGIAKLKNLRAIHLGGDGFFHSLPEEGFKSLFDSFCELPLLEVIDLEFSGYRAPVIEVNNGVSREFLPYRRLNTEQFTALFKGFSRLKNLKSIDFNPEFFIWNYSSYRRLRSIHEWTENLGVPAIEALGEVLRRHDSITTVKGLSYFEEMKIFPFVSAINKELFLKLNCQASEYKQHMNDWGKQKSCLRERDIAPFDSPFQLRSFSKKPFIFNPPSLLFLAAAATPNEILQPQLARVPDLKRHVRESFPAIQLPKECP